MLWTLTKEDRAPSPTLVSHVPTVITITPALLPPSEEHEATRKRIEQLQARRERLKEQAHELADAIRQNDTLIRAEKAKEAVFADPLALDSSPVGTFELNADEGPDTEEMDEAARAIVGGVR